MNIYEFFDEVYIFKHEKLYYILASKYAYLYIDRTYKEEDIKDKENYKKELEEKLKIILDKFYRIPEKYNEDAEDYV